MIIDEIEDLWDQRPFVPFEIRTSDGQIHLVQHEKWMLIHPNRTSLHYVNPQLHSRFVVVNQITSVTPVAIGKDRSGGGKSRGKGKV
jgi:hypothetical protein